MQMVAVLVVVVAAIIVVINKSYDPKISNFQSNALNEGPEVQSDEI